jgi:hypothetical protein
MTTETEKTNSTAIIKVFGKLMKEEINFFKPPYNVRNNCQVGQWAKSEDDFISNSLDIAIIGTQEFYGKLGKSSGNWLQIWFIAGPDETRLPKNVVCVTYIKTRSIAQFGQTIIELMSNGEPATGIFTGSFLKHSNDYGSYASVKFNWRERTEDEKAQLVLIANFLATAPILEDTGLPKTMVKVYDGNYEVAQEDFKAIMKDEASKK